MEDLLKDTLEKLLKAIGANYKKIKIHEEKRNRRFSINIESDETSLLIGYHGETIYALQHLLKVLVWSQNSAPDYSVYLDIDNYRKRQEESVIAMAERKVEQVRKTGKSQILLPMSPYFRRLVHLHLTEEGFEDIETESMGEGNQRQVVIKLKKSV